MPNYARCSWGTYLMFFTSLFESNLKVKNFAKKIIYYHSTNSTNDDIWNLYSEKNESNIVVITDNQTNGRGRSNNTWFSKPGHSITCSFLLKEIFPRKQFNLHAILIPLAVIKGIKNFLSIDLSIKWPNDIMYENKKLAGILIESKLSPENNKTIFNIGLGINVNEDCIDFPLELQKKSISLKEIKGHPIQREPLLASIFNELDLLINTMDVSNLITSWMTACHHKNIRVEFFNNKQPINGIFKHINERGQAIIHYNNKDIEYDGAINIL